MYLYHMTFSANRNVFHYHRPCSHVLEASIKTPKEILFCEQTGLFILHTKLGLVVRTYLTPLCMFIVTLKNQFYVFQTAPMVVYPSDISIEYVIARVSLTESVFM